jgi:hypothetical protein
MAKSALIDLQKLSKDLFAIEHKLSSMQDKATYRTINKVAERVRNIIAGDVWEDTGISMATAKRRITIYGAKSGYYRAKLFMKDTRVTYPSPRQLTHGASFISEGRKRVKVTHKISNAKGVGSKPFIITGQYSGKKLPVYVRPGYVADSWNRKRVKGKPHPRKVQAMYFHSLPHVARKDWQEKVQAFSIDEFRKEYPKQLKKAKY